MTTGERIKEAREKAGFTQQQLADALGIREKGIQRVSQWENGRRVPKLDVLMGIARATGAGLEWMIGEAQK